MRKRSKRYRAAAKRAADRRILPLEEAVTLLKGWEGTRFDETVEIAVKLGIDPRQSTQVVRGAISLPYGIGRELRVIAFAEGEAAQAAKEAGAIEVGGEEMAKRIEEGWLDFDVAVAHPGMMRHVGKLGRILGPQGKMPSPKAGTVTQDVDQAVAEFRAGKIEFRNDSGGNVHAPMGRKSFAPEKLAENVRAFLEYLQSIKPAGVKGAFIQKIFLTTTMGPGVRVAPA